MISRSCKHKPKMEFSKKILVVVGIINLIIIIFTMVMVAITQNLEPLSILIPTIGAEASTGIGFYYSKAKVENRIKLMKQYNVEPTPSSFNDNVDDINNYEMETML